MAHSASNKGKIIFWIVFAGALLTGGYVLAKKIFGKPADPNKKAADAAAAAKKNPTAANVKEAVITQADATAANSVPADTFPLKYGSRDVNSTYVRDVQNWLMNSFTQAATLPKYGADGIAGTETIAAIKAHISSDGVVTQDWYSKNIAPPPAASSGDNPSPDYTTAVHTPLYARADGTSGYQLNDPGKTYLMFKADALMGITSSFDPNSNYWDDYIGIAFIDGHQGMVKKSDVYTKSAAFDGSAGRVYRGTPAADKMLVQRLDVETLFRHQL